MKIKKFHLKDFPEDRIRILFKNHREFIDSNIEYFGSLNKLADFLSVSQDVINSWKRYNLFIPLKYLKKIVKKKKLNWNKIENNIIAYKGPNSSLIVKNPKLPIKESPELFTIITHLIGDGSVNKNGIPVYTNSDKKLIDNFQKSIEFVFGKIKGRIYKRTDGVYQLTSSRVISDIIKSFYNINFGSLTAKLPKRIFSLPKEYSYEVIRAIVNDEGAVRDNRISIKMKNKQIIAQIKEILIKILGKRAINRPKKRKDGSWEISIKANHLNLFERKIKLIHHEKKSSLRYAIKKARYRYIKNRSNLWETKLKILEVLKDKPQLIKNLGREFFIDNINILSHIHDLEDKFLVKKIKYGRSFKCFLTKRGRSFLGENLPQGKEKNIDLMKINYNNITKKNIRILLNENTRKKLFWFLERIQGNQRKIGKLFNVHYNTINNWKNGNTLIPSMMLNKMLVFLGENKVDIINNINGGVNEIKTINGKYKILGGINYDLHLC